MGKPNIEEIKKLLTAYGIPKSVKSLSDKRRKRQIPLSHIYYSIFFMVLLNLKSFLQTDQLMREKAVKSFFTSKRKMVVSDSTIIRNLEFNFELKELQKMNYKVFKQIEKSGYLNYQLTSDSRKRRIALIDGTGYGKYLVVRITIIGENILFPLDLRIMEKKGKELPEAEKLIDQVVGILKKSFVDLVIVDGLYKSRYFIRNCLKNGIHVLIKSGEERLSIIKDAKGMFDTESISKELEQYSGFDENRMVKYDVIAVSDMKFDGVDAPMKVARVIEKNIKTDEITSFYAFTTDVSLNALEMKEGSHSRWKIENNDFRQLNSLCKSKHDYFKRDNQNNAMMKLLLIFFLAFAILNIYKEKVLSRIEKKAKDEKETYEYAKWTFIYVCRLIYNSLFICYSERASG
ncbi:MAG: transposase [Spirochaetales bacterium]|nr:transposase [Spirochaetales bacterium]